MRQAAQHAEGGTVRGMRVTTVELPDVRAIRQKLHMSQQRFAETYRIPLPTSRNREQGRPLAGRAGRRLPTGDRAPAQSHQGSTATRMNGPQPMPLTRSFGSWRRSGSHAIPLSPTRCCAKASTRCSPAMSIPARRSCATPSRRRSVREAGRRDRHAGEKPDPHARPARQSAGARSVRNYRLPAEAGRRRSALNAWLRWARKPRGAAHP